jgi:cyclic pyranopterin phosphate synthase
VAEDLTHLDAAGQARMVDVGDKPMTQRRATAEATVRINAELSAAIVEDRVKKGDVLATARFAGITAAKRTSDLIPLCRPLPLDAVDVDAILEGERVRITATVATTYRTGVEMEAMTAASVAALTVVDMGKSLDRGIEIEHVCLLSKTGGRGGAVGEQTPRDVCVLTVSDRVSRGERPDEGGPAVAAWTTRHLAAKLQTATVPDEADRIRDAITKWLLADPALIFTTGGTGLSPRDVTPEAVAPLLDRPHPQLLDLARQRLLATVPKAALSRGVAGVSGRTLVLTLPGSPRGAVETLDALADVLPHALKVLRDEDDPHASSGAG